MIFIHVWSQTADPVQEVTELRQQLQSSEREKEMFRQQLMRKEAELTTAEETIRREQQQIQEMRQQVWGGGIVMCGCGASHTHCPSSHGRAASYCLASVCICMCICVCCWGGGVLCYWVGFLFSLILCAIC